MTKDGQMDLAKIKDIMQKNQEKDIHLIYLFLDFDGVINVFFRPGTKEYEKKAKEAVDAFEFADRDSVKRLNQFCHDFDVRVVISSSWRFGGLKECIKYLKKAGLDDHVQIVGTTQTDIFQSRELDIAQYLMGHPDFAGLLIFDDMKMPDLNNFLVQTDSFHGWDIERDRYARYLAKKF